MADQTKSQVNIDDVLLYRVSETACASPRPKEGDDPHITRMKAFIMTCLHRLNIDPDFEREMHEWLEKHSAEIGFARLN